MKHSGQGDFIFPKKIAHIFNTGFTRLFQILLPTKVFEDALCNFVSKSFGLPCIHLSPTEKIVKSNKNL